MPLRIQGLRNVNIQAVAGALDYRQVSQILKETLLMIMGGLILAFFTLLLEYLLGKPGERKHSFQPIMNQKSFTRRGGRPVSAAAAARPPPVREEPAEQPEEDLTFDDGQEDEIQEDETQEEEAQQEEAQE